MGGPFRAGRDHVPGATPRLPRTASARQLRFRRWPGKTRFGSPVPIAEALRSQIRLTSRWTSVGVAFAPRCAAAIDHSESPRRTVVSVAWALPEDDDVVDVDVDVDVT